MNCKNKTYLLKDICFNLNKGDCLGIIGKSGSGKSVTIKTIMARSAVLMGIESLVIDAEGEYVVVAESLCTSVKSLYVAYTLYVP